jgi:predicted Zn-dependent protease
MSSRRAKLIGLAWLLLAVAIAAGASKGFAALAHIVPFKTEQKMARAIKFGPAENVCKKDDGARILKKLVTRLYPLPGDNPAIQIHVSVVHNPQVNAHAMLGGDIFVNQGLLKQAESPEELAGVISHEIAHVVDRHVLENLMMRLGTWGAVELAFGTPSSGTDMAMMLMNLQYSRGQERAADRGGLKRLVKADVNVKGFEDFFKRMHKKGAGGPEFFSDHPSDISREEMAEAYAGHKSRPVLSAAEWQELKGICGK